MKKICAIFIILLSFPVMAQEPAIEGETKDAFEDRFNLHAKMHVTRRCSLHVLLNTDGQTLWFVDLVKRKHKTKEDLGIHKITKRQKKLSQKRGVVVLLPDLIADFASFRYMTKPEDGSKNHFVLHYTNTKNEEAVTKINLHKIYNLYTDASTTFQFDDKNRSCVEER